jgi:hypothetical protein
MTESTQMNTVGHSPAQGMQDFNPAERATEAEVRAMVEARVLMAMRRPRDIFQTRGKLMEACARPAFAETALYRKPVGKKKNETTGAWEQNYVEGPSIRFAEEAYRALGNLWASITVQFENSEKRIVRMDLMDLESNNTDSSTITVAKTVERKKVQEGQVVIGTRLNSYGEKVYIVEATDDEVGIKQAALVAKARRDAIIRMLPSDLKEEAIARIKESLASRDKADPKGQFKKLLDAFQAKGIMPDQLEKYLDHKLEVITPAEIDALRGVYVAINEGDLTWVAVLKAVEEDRAGAMKASADKAASKKLPKDAQKDGQGTEKTGTEGNTSGNPPEPPKEPSTPLERAKAQAAKTGASISAGAANTLDIPLE